MGHRDQVGRIARAVAIVGVLIALPVVNAAQSEEPVDALAPAPAACAGNPSFCGITLRIDSDAGTIPSVAAGAHYGLAWGIPATGNNSTGVGWCVDDTHTGFPVGPIREQALPESWAPHDMSRAATIITLYGGDRVLPYQPLPVDRAGELVGIDSAGIPPTRHRQIAVWFALRSLLPDAAGTPRIDLSSATTFSDPGGRRSSAIGDSAVQLARRLVAVADAMTSSGPATLTVTAADGRTPSTVDTPGFVTVRLEDRNGTPLPDHPVWPTPPTNATVTIASDDAIRRSIPFLNAEATGWPSLDPNHHLSNATVTDASGEARFAIAVEEPGRWRVGFEAATLPSEVRLFGDGINAQNNVTIRAGKLGAMGSLTGEVVDRYVRVVKESSDPTFGVGGAVIAVIDADGNEIARGTTDGSGVIDFPPFDDDHPTPIAIREVTPPVGLALHIGDIEVGADGGLSSDPSAPTVVEIVNHPVDHDLRIQKEVVGSAGFGPSLAGFTFAITRDVDDAPFGTVETDDAGRTPSIAVPAGQYSIREITRPTRWPGDEPVPDPVPVTVPIGSAEPIVISFENALPPPSIATRATDRADGDKYLSADGGTIADEVALCGLVEGTTYTITGELMFVDADSGAVESTDIRSVADFVASPDDDGCESLELDFDLPTDSVWTKRRGHFVVTEELSVGADRVATHDDTESIEQSVFVAKVRSLAVDSVTGDSWIDRGGGTVLETLSVSDLDASRPDVELRADSELMILQPNGEVSPTEASGTSTFVVGDVADRPPTVEIVYSSTDLSTDGGTAVVFTTLTDVATGNVIAEHHDPLDQDQQVHWRPVPTEPPPVTHPPPQVPPSAPAGDLPRTGGGSTALLQRSGSALALVGSLMFVASGTRRRRNPKH